jgi:hypothetical protein
MRKTSCFFMMAATRRYRTFLIHPIAAASALLASERKKKIPTGPHAHCVTQ